MITEDIFIDFSFLIIAVISQLSSALIVLRLALLKRFESKILLVLSVFLIVIVCPLTIYNLLVIRESIEFSIKLILTLISILVLYFVIGLTRNETIEPAKINNSSNLKNLTQISIFLGIIALFSSLTLGYLGYSANSRTLIENIHQINQTAAQTVSTYINLTKKNKVDNALVQELQFFWNKINPLNFESYITLISNKGKIILDSSKKIRPGTYVGYVELNSENKKPGTLIELIKSKKDWYGENNDPAGQTQFVAYTYSENLDCIIAVHVPAKQINEQINVNTIPWLMAFVFITLILLPLSLGLLHWAYTISQKNIISTQLNLRKSLEEKEILLKEIHHRVKNNLQIIYSLLGLQSKYSKDPNYLDLIQESQQRIKTMAIIHENLYQSKDLGKIDFSRYVKNLCNYLYESYRVNSNPLKLDLKIENIFLDIDTAIPCGLIINELFSNSLKHAFNENTVNLIRVHFFSNENNYFLIIGDNGKGLNPGFDIKKSDSLGLKLVGTLVKQLKGHLNIKTEDGTEFIITFRESG